MLTAEETHEFARHEGKRAEQEAHRADAEGRRADQEAKRARALTDEVERLRQQLRQQS